MPGWAARTGKEEDIEVGLVYFGKRFYSPYLGRWVSPDPLAVHVPGAADLNLYAYVHGQTLRAIDPAGLDASTFIVKVGEKAAKSPSPLIRAAGVGLLAGAAAGYLIGRAIWGPEIDKANQEAEKLRQRTAEIKREIERTRVALREQEARNKALQEEIDEIKRSKTSGIPLEVG